MHGPGAPDAEPNPLTDASADSALADSECNEAPDTECPEMVPLPGAACEGELLCTEYGFGRGFSGRWHVECLDGQWNILERPTSFLGEHPLPSAERCREPFEGERAGVHLRVGPEDTDGFRPYVDGEEVRLSRGGQGSYMLEFQLDAEGARDLDCLLFDASARIGDGEESRLSLPAEFHCGQTRRVYLELNPPLFDQEACESGIEEATHPLELRVSLPGLAEVSVPLTLVHPTCPLIGGGSRMGTAGPG